LVAGVLVLGWFSALGEGRGDGSLAASGPVGRRLDGRAHVVVSGRASRGASGAGQSPAQVPRRPVVRQVPQLIPGLPPLPPRRWLAPKGTQRQPDAPAVDCHVVKCVALTFDDGPGPYTRRLLAMLAAAHHAKVTFFLIGGNIVGREGIVRQEVAQGHAIGDHTWDHRDLSTLSKGAIRSELTRTRTEIVRVTGGPVKLMRPPYGATDKRVGRVARGLKMAQIVWDVDTDDWLDRNSAIVAHRAITRAHRGDIILMHDIHPTTVNAVPRILRGLAKRGFTFVTVPDLLAAHPLKPGKVYYSEG
jgi:peptidoglycan-N-acetylglucosamine deacetylase